MWIVVSYVNDSVGQIVMARMGTSMSTSMRGEYEDEYEFIEASQAWVGKYVSERHESWSGAC